MHLNIKRGNILLSHTGHILVTDFDCSYGTTIRNCPPRLTGYRGNRAFKAPEVASKTSFSCKADVWSFGALLVRMTVGYVRFPKESTAEKRGKWTIDGFEYLPKTLQYVMKSCLRFKVSIGGVKRFRFFKGVNWSSVQSQSKPPLIQLLQLSHYIVKEIPCASNYQ